MQSFQAERKQPLVLLQNKIKVGQAYISSLAPEPQRARQLRKPLLFLTAGSISQAPEQIETLPLHSTLTGVRIYTSGLKSLSNLGNTLPRVLELSHILNLFLILSNLNPALPKTSI